jgi:hypothetical protein
MGVCAEGTVLAESSEAFVAKIAFPWSGRGAVPAPDEAQSQSDRLSEMAIPPSISAQAASSQRISLSVMARFPSNGVRAAEVRGRRRISGVDVRKKSQSDL